MRARQEYQEFRPVELFDVAVMESWLEERDREGYHLLRFRGLYGIFIRIALSPPAATGFSPCCGRRSLHRRR